MAVLINFKAFQSMLEQGFVIIDPRVTGAVSTYENVVPLDSYNASTNNTTNCSTGFFEGCSYNWPVEVPGGVTVTNVIFVARIETIAPCTRNKMRYRYRVGGNKCGENITWSTKDDPVSPGITGGEEFPTDLYNSCFSTGCTPTINNVQISILRNCMGSAGCDAACVRGIGPFLITVEGHTLELVSAGTLEGDQICHGENLTLVAIAEYGIPAYSYRWMPGNMSGDSISVKPENNTNYTLSLTDACGRTVTDNLRVEVSPPTREDSLSLEDCGIVTFEGRQYTSNQVWKDTLRGQWGCDSLIRSIRIGVFPLDPKDEIKNYNGCEFVDFEGVRYYQSTQLNDTFTNTNGCDSIYRKVAIVVEDFNLDLQSSVSPDSLFIGQTIELSASSNKDLFRVISWEPTPMFPGQDLLKQQIRVQADVTYTISGETEDGCTDVAILRLVGKEIPSSSLYPSSFSPNGDGNNDIWKPLKEITQIEVWVYNRWGECVFHSTDSNHQWDGTFQGVKVPQGAYGFKFIAYDQFESRGIVNVFY